MLKLIRQHGFWLGTLTISLLATAAAFLWLMEVCNTCHKALQNLMLKDKVLKSTIGNQFVEASKKVRPEHLRSTISDLQAFTERNTWEKQAETCQYIQARLQAIGLEPEFYEYQHQNHTFHNIAVSFPGCPQPEKKLLAVAHYDSKNWKAEQSSPGGDDNATGVSVLLELAEVIKTLNHRKTWQLVFFSNEEQGQQGSRSYARQAAQEQSDIAAVISVDSVGYKPPGISELFSIIEAPFNFHRKLKGLAKVFYNGHLACRTNCAVLKMPVRKEDLALVPQKPIREAMGERITWQLGKACT